MPRRGGVVEEERRLAYVACSRAKRSLRVTYSEQGTTPVSFVGELQVSSIPIVSLQQVCTAPSTVAIACARLHVPGNARAVLEGVRPDIALETLFKYSAVTRSANLERTVRQLWEVALTERTQESHGQIQEPHPLDAVDDHIRAIAARLPSQHEPLMRCLLDYEHRVLAWKESAHRHRYAHAPSLFKVSPSLLGMYFHYGCDRYLHRSADRFEERGSGRSESLIGRSSLSAAFMGKGTTIKTWVASIVRRGDGRTGV